MSWELGAPFEPEAGRFVREKDGRFDFMEKVRFGKWRARDVSFYTRDGRLHAVTIEFYEEGRSADMLMGLLKELCSPFTNELEWHHPSPPGTPEPGEKWDPIQSSIAECGGVKDGVTVKIEGSTHEASDLHKGEIHIHLGPAKKSP